MRPSGAKTSSSEPNPLYRMAARKTAIIEKKSKSNAAANASEIVAGYHKLLESKFAIKAAPSRLWRIRAFAAVSLLACAALTFTDFRRLARFEDACKSIHGTSESACDSFHLCTWSNKSYCERNDVLASACEWQYDGKMEYSERRRQKQLLYSLIARGALVATCLILLVTASRACRLVACDLQVFFPLPRRHWNERRLY